MKKSRILYIVLLALLFSLAPIKSRNLPDTPAMHYAQAATAAPVAEKTKVTLYAGYKNHTIKFKNLSSKATVTYKTSNSKVATVTSKGVVKPVAKGTATITATIKQNSKTYTVKISVTVKNPFVTISNAVKEMTAGQSVTLKAKTNGLKNPKIQWSSSNTKIASVGKTNGKVTAKAEGTVTITAKDTVSGKKTSVNITVKSSNYVIKWKDANFEKAIRELLKKPTGDIRKNDVKDITYLILAGCNIKAIDDIVHFENLTELNLGYFYDYWDFDYKYNYISDIRPLASLTKLENLDLYGNPIDDYINELGKLKSLKELKLSVTKAKDISALGK